MNKRERTVLIICLILVDALALVLALLLAYYLRIASGLLHYEYPHEVASYLRMIAVAVPIFLLICVNARLYDPDSLFGGPEEYAHVIRACTFGVIALMVLSFWERGDLLSRGWLILAWVLSMIMMATARFAFRRVVFHLRRRGLFVTRALVVGANEQAKAIVRQLHGSRVRGIQIVGFLDDYLPLGTPVMDGLEVLGSPTELELLTRETGAAEAIIVPQALAWESFQEIIQKAASRVNGLEVKLSPGFYEILTTGVKVNHSTLVPLLSVERVRITGLDALLKNMLDYGLGLLLFVLTAPFVVLVSLALWKVQGRPILDRHPVLGLGGRPFSTHKFRTGVLGSTRRSLVYPLPNQLADGEQASGLGSFLYRTGLDKMPQLINVLQGQMSLVGPRTINDASGDLYGPWLPSVLTVKPGMTGPWAVESVPTLDDEIRLTMYYIRNWTIWFDLQILFGTLRRVLPMKGIRRSRGAGDMALPATSEHSTQEVPAERSGILDSMGEEWTP